MKVIIAGSRSVNDIQPINAAMAKWCETNPPPMEVVSGTCPGPDQLGECWAHHRAIPVKLFPANWKLYGKAAGPIRNEQMAKYADALVAVWDGASRGTSHIIGYMRTLNKPVLVWRV